MAGSNEQRPLNPSDIIAVVPGIVRNLLKQDFFLRIIRDYRDDKNSVTLRLPPQVDTELEFRDFYHIEKELVDLDQRNILRIIQYPISTITPGTVQVFDDGNLIQTNVQRINFVDNIAAFADGAGRVDISVKLPLIGSLGGLPTDPTPGQQVYVSYGPYNGIYYWDFSRGKWLSQESHSFSWNSRTDTATVNVGLTSHEDGGVHPDSDNGVAWPITITGAMATQVNAASGGNAARFEIASFDLSTGSLTNSVVALPLTTDTSAQNLTLNVDVPARSVLSARRVKVSGTQKVRRPTMSIFYRLRLA